MLPGHAMDCDSGPAQTQLQSLSLKAPSGQAFTQSSTYRDFIYIIVYIYFFLLALHYLKY